jgi:hypothetical protein
MALANSPAQTRALAVPVGRTHTITVQPDGSFTPARVEIFSGDTVEWRFTSRADTIIPVNLNTLGQPDCDGYKPYDPADPNEFTGPMPRAVSGIFSLSPEELPYTSEESTWRGTNITGVFIRPRWDDVHRGPGQFHWVELDAEIDQAVRHGKVFNLGFKAGVKGTPQWIFDPKLTDAAVIPLDFGYKQAGKPAYYGSPADANFRKHYFDLLRAAAAHLRERNAWYRALAYIKPSGANLFTHENRLPNDTTEQLATWAGPGRYTPSALYEFYQQQETLLADEFPGKDLDFALIQDGFPLINDFGEYAGQTPRPLHPLPRSAEQTETLLSQGRINHGLRFVVAHNGLQRKPDFCPGSGVHPVIVDPSFHYVGSGCPNRWVLEQAALGQVTGFQTTNDLLADSDVDSALQNAWDNSDGIYVELYEANVRQADSGGVLPSGFTLGQWTEKFHQRRRALFPGIPDPFPLTHRHTFIRTTTGNAPQELHFVNGSRCAAGATSNYGSIVILPELSFAAILLEPNNSIRLHLKVARAGTLLVETSPDLNRWNVLESRSAEPGLVEVTDVPPPGRGRYYRATLLNPY